MNDRLNIIFQSYKGKFNENLMFFIATFLLTFVITFLVFVNLNNNVQNDLINKLPLKYFVTGNSFLNLSDDILGKENNYLKLYEDSIKEIEKIEDENLKVTYNFVYRDHFFGISDLDFFKENNYVLEIDQKAFEENENALIYEDNNEKEYVKGEEIFLSFFPDMKFKVVGKYYKKIDNFSKSYIPTFEKGGVFFVKNDLLFKKVKENKNLISKLNIQNITFIAKNYKTYENLNDIISRLDKTLYKACFNNKFFECGNLEYTSYFKDGQIKVFYSSKNLYTYFFIVIFLVLYLIIFAIIDYCQNSIRKEIFIQYSLGSNSFNIHLYYFMYYLILVLLAILLGVLFGYYVFNLVENSLNASFKQLVEKNVKENILNDLYSFKHANKNILLSFILSFLFSVFAVLVSIFLSTQKILNSKFNKELRGN